MKHFKMALTLAFASLLFAQAQAPVSAQEKGEVGIVAHRGFWNCEEAGYTNNSIAALKCAQDNGFWGSEFDVNMTSDGVLIVYHDSSVEGYRIEKNPYSTFENHVLKNGEKIPTIDDYLKQGKKSRKTMLVYELKPHSTKEVEEKFVNLTIEKLEEHKLLDPQRVMFISFSFHICELMAARLPGFTVQYLEANKSPEKVKKTGINGIDYNWMALVTNPQWIKEAHNLDMSVNTWTVNEEKDMKKLITLGVDFLTTDNPLEARKVISEMEYKELK